MKDDSTIRRRFRTSGVDAGRILRDFMADRCSETPVGFLNKLIRKGFVTVDGQKGELATVLTDGQKIALRLPSDAFLVAPNAEVSFRVIHEDEDLIVVEKPSGVVSEPGIGHKLDTLLNGLIARYGAELDRLGPRCDYGMAHRLDRDTSGLLVVARNATVQRALRRAFQAREVSKCYDALVLGRLKRHKGVVSVPLGRRRRKGRLEAIVGGPDAKRAATHYEVVEDFGETTLIRARPESGRWHQIRLHMTALGHPIAGDVEHGDDEANQKLEEQYGLDRLFLHASTLKFVHPVSGSKLRFRSPLPKELAAVVEKLR
jgi:23S rRNA pseudouridine1911/1915/1917 synthase